jgi:hypothetical protein
LGKGQGSHLFSGGVVKEIICIENVLVEVKNVRVFTMYNKLKQWRKWAGMFPGYM